MRINIDKVFGDNKERDAEILNKFWKEKVEIPELAQTYNITESRIYQILENNSTLISIDKAHAKNLRVRRLEVEISRKNRSNKDVLDLLEQHRKETDGESPLIDQRTFVQNVNYGWQSDEENNNPLQATVIPAGNSRLPVEVSSGENRAAGREDGTLDQ